MTQEQKEIRRTVLYLLAVFVVTMLVVCYVGQRTIVDGSSMEPTLSDGDNLIVDKISYHLGEPQRYDIVVFPCGEDGTYLIKRIIGLPGETVQIDEDGAIYIDGEHLIESYGREVMENPGLAKEPILLGDDEYFVLGDNRNDSLDSRNAQVGMVHREDIIGRAWMRIYPLDKIGIMSHS